MDRRISNGLKLTDALSIINEHAHSIITDEAKSLSKTMNVPSQAHPSFVTSFPEDETPQNSPLLNSPLMNVFSPQVAPSGLSFPAKYEIPKNMPGKSTMLPAHPPNIMNQRPSQQKPRQYQAKSPPEYLGGNQSSNSKVTQRARKTISAKKTIYTAWRSMPAVLPNISSNRTHPLVPQQLNPTKWKSKKRPASKSIGAKSSSNSRTMADGGPYSNQRTRPRPSRVATKNPSRTTLPKYRSRPNNPGDDDDIVMIGSKDVPLDVQLKWEKNPTSTDTTEGNLEPGIKPPSTVDSMDRKTSMIPSKVEELGENRSLFEQNREFFPKGKDAMPKCLPLGVKYSYDAEYEIIRDARYIGIIRTAYAYLLHSDHKHELESNEEWEVLTNDLKELIDGAGISFNADDEMNDYNE